MNLDLLGLSNPAELPSEAPEPMDVEEPILPFRCGCFFDNKDLLSFDSKENILPLIKSTYDVDISNALA